MKDLFLFRIRPRKLWGSPNQSKADVLRKMKDRCGEFRVRVFDGETTAHHATATVAIAVERVKAGKCATGICIVCDRFIIEPHAVVRGGRWVCDKHDPAEVAEFCNMSIADVRKGLVTK